MRTSNDKTSTLINSIPVDVISNKCLDVLMVTCSNDLRGGGGGFIINHYPSFIILNNLCLFDDTD